MAGIKITDLPAAPSAQLTDVFPVDQLPGPVTYKESNSQLLTLFKANGEALSAVNDTNVTLTLGGSPGDSLLNATSLTLGWTGILSPSRGGTGINNGSNTLTLGGNLVTSGAFNSTFTMTGLTTVTFPTSGTLATTSQLPTPSALTKVDDTNVTLTLGGTPATALLQATSLTLGWTGTLGGSRGGTGVNNGSNTATYGGNLNFASSFTTSGAFAVTQTYTGITNVTFPTSGTLATTSQIPTGAALTKTDDTNVTLTLGGSPTTALVNAASLTLGWTGQLGLTRGGTNASLTASNGGIVYSTSSALEILSGTATANQMLQSGASTTPSWSTTTWPATSTINQILYSSSGNVISGLATANNGILVTSAGGVPSIGNTVGAGLTMPSITFNTTSGVIGTTTNDNAAAGSVGEIIESNVPLGSAISLSTGVTANITSISLTAGDWDVWGNVLVQAASGTLVQRIDGGISTVSASIPTPPNGGAWFRNVLTYTASSLQGVPIGKVRLSLGGTTTVYLCVFANFTVSTCTAYGYIGARRRR